MGIVPALGKFLGDPTFPDAASTFDEQGTFAMLVTLPLQEPIIKLSFHIITLFAHDFPNVLHDTYAICEDAVRELLDIGCGDVAYVGWFERTYWCDDKRSAVRELLELHGKHYYEFIPSRREATDAALLNRRLCTWLRKLPKPCGFLRLSLGPRHAPPV